MLTLNHLLERDGFGGLAGTSDGSSASFTSESPASARLADAISHTDRSRCHSTSGGEPPAVMSETFIRYRTGATSGDGPWPSGQ